MSETVPKITFLVTCKGRLQMLQQTIDALVQQPDIEYVMVDYACPQKSGTWVRTKYPQEKYPHVKVVSVTGIERWSVGLAQNIGVRYATGEHIFITDADILCRRDIAALLYPHLSQEAFWRPNHFRVGTYGTFCVPRLPYLALDCRDAVMDFFGYTASDIDVHRRFKAAGVRESHFPWKWISHIPHSDTVRRAHLPVPLELSANTSFTYMKIIDQITQKLGKRPSDYARGQLIGAMQAVTGQRVFHHVRAVPQSMVTLAVPGSPRLDLGTYQMLNGMRLKVMAADGQEKESLVEAMLKTAIIRCY